MKQFGVEIDEDYSPRYNISPSQQVRVLKLAEDSGAAASGMPAMQMHIQRWGLVPAWAKDVKIGYKMINARSETIMEKPSFRTAFKKRRCLIPADGFYEWKKEGNGSGKAKQPFHFGMKDDSLFAFAGIWELWKASSVEGEVGTVVESCAILTTTPNELVADVHDRMPVILPAAQYGLWLTAEAERVAQLQDLLVPYPAGEMKKYPVSSVVNSPKNDVAACAAAAAG